MKTPEKILQILRRQHHQTMLSRIGNSPFMSLIATVLSARARDETTEVIARELFRHYNTPKKLAGAKQSDIERIIHKSGFYKVKAKRIIELSQIILERHKGRVPRKMEDLLLLPGVGRKTAGCVLVYAFNQPAIPVDTHVHRISNRIGLVRTRHPEKTEQALMKLFPKRLWIQVNDLFVFHGKTICRPVRPLCEKCTISSYCKYYR